MENMEIKTVKLEMHFDKEVGEAIVVAEVPQYVADTVRTFGIQDAHLYIIYEEAGEYFPEDASYDCGDGYGEYANYIPRLIKEVKA